MARKSNKQHQSRKQRKQQRRKARTSRRDAGRSRARPTSSPFDKDTIADMGPFLNVTGDTVFPGAGMEGLMVSMIASEDMADEPELRSIIIDPVRCVNTFAEAGEEMGYTPKTLAKLPEDEHEKVQMQILETSVQRVLSKSLQQEILAGLKALRARWKKEGKPEAAARAAALQSFLVDEERLSTWAMIGLVQAVFHRNMMLGFELFEAAAGSLDTEGAEEEGVSFVERMHQSSATQKIGALLQAHPEVKDFMAHEADRVWEEGQEAIFSGEPNLGLFTAEELQGGFELFTEIVGYDETSGEHKEISASPEEVGDLVSRIDAYVGDLLTAQRFVQMQERLALVLKEKTFEKKWFPFVLLVAEDMKAEGAIVNQRGLLVRAFFGEMRELIEHPDEDADDPGEIEFSDEDDNDPGEIESPDEDDNDPGGDVAS